MSTTRSAVLVRGGDPPEPPGAHKTPVTSSPGPWALARGQKDEG